jgi:excisionase family DNA binding protein
MPPFGCGWRTSSRRSRCDLPERCLLHRAAPLVASSDPGCWSRSLTAPRPDLEPPVHLPGEPADEPAWRTRRGRPPQQVERPRDLGDFHPTARFPHLSLADVTSEQNAPGRRDPSTARRRPEDSHARRNAGPVVDDQEIIQLYVGDRLTLRQIRERLAVSHSRIVRVLDRHHIARRPPGPRSRVAVGDQQAERQIVDRYLSGLSLRQAGSPFGAGRTTVTAILGRHGIASRPAGRPRQRVSAAASLAASDGDRLLRARDVSAMLGVSRRTTYRLIGSGDLEAVRVSPRGVRVRQSALRAYLRLRQAQAPGGVDAICGDGEALAALPKRQASGASEGEGPYLQAGAVIILLTSEVTTVGRGADCGIRLNDPSVALLHAELVSCGRCVFVVALGGSIGTTRVNGRTVSHCLALGDGDVISFGQVSCTVGGLAAQAEPT